MPKSMRPMLVAVVILSGLMGCKSGMRWDWWRLSKTGAPDSSPIARSAGPALPSELAQHEPALANNPLQMPIVDSGGDAPPYVAQTPSYKAPPYETDASGHLSRGTYRQDGTGVAGATYPSGYPSTNTADPFPSGAPATGIAAGQRSTVQSGFYDSSDYSQPGNYGATPNYGAPPSYGTPPNGPAASAGGTGSSYASTTRPDTSGNDRYGFGSQSASTSPGLTDIPYNVSVDEGLGQVAQGAVQAPVASPMSNDARYASANPGGVSTAAGAPYRPGGTSDYAGAVGTAEYNIAARGAAEQQQGAVATEQPTSQTNPAVDRYSYPPQNENMGSGRRY